MLNQSGTSWQPAEPIENRHKSRLPQPTSVAESFNPSGRITHANPRAKSVNFRNEPIDCSKSLGPHDSDSTVEGTAVCRGLFGTGSVGDLDENAGVAPVDQTLRFLKFGLLHQVRSHRPMSKFRVEKVRSRLERQTDGRIPQFAGRGSKSKLQKAWHWIRRNPWKCGKILSQPCDSCENDYSRIVDVNG